MKTLVTLTLILSVEIAAACKCDGDFSVKSSYNSADIVIIGEVLETELVSISDLIGSDVEISTWNNSRDSVNYFSPLIIKVRLKVERTYKDKLTSEEIVVLTPRLSASCGFTRFKRDEQFIIYGFKKFIFTSFFPEVVQNEFEENNLLWTHHCVRTTEYNTAEETKLTTLEDG